MPNCKAHIQYCGRFIQAKDTGEWDRVHTRYELSAKFHTWGEGGIVPEIKPYLLTFTFPSDSFSTYRHFRGWRVCEEYRLD